MSGNLTTRWRRVVLDQFDEALLTLALIEAFPHLRIVCQTNYLVGPALDERPDLVQSDHWAATMEVLFPDVDWLPIFLPELPRGSFYFLVNRPRHWIFYRRGGWMRGTSYGEEPHWSFSLPTPTCGDFIVEYDRQNENDRTFVRTVWKILDRITSNLLKSELPHLGVVYSESERTGTRAGHHVLEWCREVPDRMLDGCLRPVDGWKAPDTAWHRRLRERVIERFGAGLGVPPPRVPL